MPTPPKPERDEPVKLSLDPEEAIRALLRVKPDQDDPGGHDEDTNEQK